MFHVKQISRATFDRWEIDGSGLPARVENAMRKVGVRTLGEMRQLPEEVLLSYRSLGRISLRHIRKFLQLCDRIDADTMDIASAGDVFKLFLDEDERKVLTRRYGLERTDLKASRHYYTLQQIANRNGRTRERVRQVEAVSIEKMSSRMAKLFLHAIADEFSLFMEERDGTVTEAELAPLLGRPDLTPINPCSLLLLIHDLIGDRISRQGHAFSILSDAELLAIEDAALARLQAFDRPRPLDHCFADWAEAPADASRPAWRKAAAVLLAQHPKVAVTRTGQYGRYDTAFGSFLRSLLKTFERPTHFRDVAKAGNLQLEPDSQKGSGFYLKQLNLMPDCSRIERGYYQLASRRQSTPASV